MIKMFDAAFTTQETFYQHPELRQGAVLRPQALSALSTKTRRMYSPAIARAFTYLATGELTILQSPDAAIKVSYMTSDHKVIECHSLPLKSDPARRLWLFNQEHPSAHAVLALTEAVLTPHWPQALQAVKVLAQESGYPITTDALHAVPGSNDDFVTALMRFVDTLYYEGKGQERQIAVQAEVTDPAPYAARATTNDGVRPERITRVIGLDGGQPRSASGGRSHVDRLIRLTERGGVAMLVGPPATFKTETVKHVVQRTGAQVVKMRGAPGVEDRDFIGTVMPGETGARWQDGPLAVAFGLAYFGRTVIHIDEILRYLPETLNVFITAMDELSYDEAVTVLRSKFRAMPEDEFTTMTQSLLTFNGPGERYYMLDLPNGEIMFAPKRHLTWIMTTNWGEDHMQVANNVDSALLSRVDLVIDYVRAERLVTQPIYEAVSGGDATAAELTRIVSELEDVLYHEYEKGELGLARPMDPRKSIAMLKEARAAVDAGWTIPDAVLEAALVTAVPQCVPRAASGALVQATRESVLNLTENVLRQVSVFNIPSRRVRK